ncbi:RsmB/NOP family class I SAM-dependent RNA methyltransferase, partial [Aquibium sp. A9E412]|uniref:RsmB/NOP family class I SAM-dependent RNA methyltransferase n=1 Tax=Aquibium sp. A9E412 TaxID=2976767 RepID=UPI0025B055D0
LAAAPDGVRADVPAWCEPLFARAFGAGWPEEGAALAARPPLDLRVNRLKAERDKVAAALMRAGAAPAALAPDGLRVPATEAAGRHPNVQADPAFRKGWFEVQDEGSQLAAVLAAAAPGEQVVDFCAGAGGKTLALAAAMDNRGQIFAHDADRARLAPIVDRLKRAGTRNVQVVAGEDELAPLAGAADLVLVDAPCTGSGTWRRRPDAKWRLTDRQLAARQAEQAAVLDAAARYVRPGGRLVYVTCSLFAEENDDQVAAFLERAPGFAAADHAALWRRQVPAGEGRARIGRHGLVLSPALTGTDGFFVASLARAG